MAGAGAWLIQQLPFIWVGEKNRLGTPLCLMALLEHPIHVTQPVAQFNYHFANHAIRDRWLHQGVSQQFWEMLSFSERSRKPPLPPEAAWRMSWSTQHLSTTEMENHSVYQGYVRTSCQTGNRQNPVSGDPFYRWSYRLTLKYGCVS